MARVILDAGHGGYDNGAQYDGRKEKDDNLRLTLAVGQILEQMESSFLHKKKRYLPVSIGESKTWQ